MKNQKLLLSKLFSHLAKNIKKEIDEGLKIVLNIYEHQKNNKQKLRKEILKKKTIKNQPNMFHNEKMCKIAHIFCNICTILIYATTTIITNLYK